MSVLLVMWRWVFCLARTTTTKEILEHTFWIELTMEPKIFFGKGSFGDAAVKRGRADGDIGEILYREKELVTWSVKHDEGWRVFLGHHNKCVTIRKQKVLPQKWLIILYQAATAVEQVVSNRWYRTGGTGALNNYSVLYSYNTITNILEYDRKYLGKQLGNFLRYSTLSLQLRTILVESLWPWSVVVVLSNSNDYICVHIDDVSDKRTSPPPRTFVFRRSIFLLMVSPETINLNHKIFYGVCACA